MLSTLIKKKSILYILFLLASVKSFSQTNTDTLILWGKKYPIIKSSNYLISINGINFVQFTSQYKVVNKTFPYNTFGLDTCALKYEYANDGGEIITKCCSSNEIISRKLNHFVDSIVITKQEFENFDSKLKIGASLISLSHIQLIFDNCIVNYNYPNKLIKSGVISNEYIILNELFYVDEKEQISYYLPFEFLLKIK